MARRPHMMLYGALALSLAVNLAGAGFLLASDRDGGKSRRTVDDTIAFVAKRYPDAVGDAIKARLEARRDELGRALSEMQAARRATREAMSLDPVDRPRLDDAFATSRARSTDFQKVIHQAIAEAMSSAPADERAKVVRNDRD